MANFEEKKLSQGQSDMGKDASKESSAPSEIPNNNSPESENSEGESGSGDSGNFSLSPQSLHAASPIRAMPDSAELIEGSHLVSSKEQQQPSPNTVRKKLNFSIDLLLGGRSEPDNDAVSQNEAAHSSDVDRVGVNGNNNDNEADKEDSDLCCPDNDTRSLPGDGRGLVDDVTDDTKAGDTVGHDESTVTTNQEAVHSGVEELAKRSPVDPSSTQVSPRTSQTKKKLKRTQYTREDLQRLNLHFQQNPWLSPEKQESLATNMGYTETQIKTWFQNKRASIFGSRRPKKRPLQELCFNQSLTSQNLLPPPSQQQQQQQQQHHLPPQHQLQQQHFYRPVLATSPPQEYPQDFSQRNKIRKENPKDVSNVLRIEKENPIHKNSLKASDAQHSFPYSLNPITAHPSSFPASNMYTSLYPYPTLAMPDSNTNPPKGDAYFGWNIPTETFQNTSPKNYYDTSMSPSVVPFYHHYFPQQYPQRVMDSSQNPSQMVHMMYAPGYPPYSLPVPYHYPSFPQQAWGHPSSPQLPTTGPRAIVKSAFTAVNSSRAELLRNRQRSFRHNPPSHHHSRRQSSTSSTVTNSPDNTPAKDNVPPAKQTDHESPQNTIPISDLRVNGFNETPLQLQGQGQTPITSPFTGQLSTQRVNSSTVYPEHYLNEQSPRYGQSPAPFSAFMREFADRLHNTANRGSNRDGGNANIGTSNECSTSTIPPHSLRVSAADEAIPSHNNHDRVSSTCSPKAGEEEVDIE